MKRINIYNRQIINKIFHYLNLETDADNFDLIHASIEKDVVLKGANLWILVFAILVASVGLNMNSTAVIIGAMLISPLMGPIIGLGYSIATYNFELFRKASKNFLFAVIAAILASTLYFSISPISTAHSELLARTSPSIYDVLIAFFGGLAGIVAISTKNKGNVIPGVAIATALMPPLCTSGYGLATGQWTYFFGAFYLFTINTVFIAFSSLIISQYLRFPIRSVVDANKKSKINKLITTVILLTIVPSIYFGYGLVKNEQFIDRSSRFIRNVSTFDNNFLIKHETDVKSKKIKLIYSGSPLNELQKTEIREKLVDFRLTDANIVFESGFATESTMNTSYQTNELYSKIVKLNAVISQKQLQIDSLRGDAVIGKQILNELRVFYPSIVSVVHLKSMQYSVEEKSTVEITVVVVKTNQEVNNTEKKKIIQWLHSRLNEVNVDIFFEMGNKNFK